MKTTKALLAAAIMVTSLSSAMAADPTVINEDNVVRNMNGYGSEINFNGLINDNVDHARLGTNGLVTTSANTSAYYNNNGIGLFDNNNVDERTIIGPDGLGIRMNDGKFIDIYRNRISVGDLRINNLKEGYADMDAVNVKQLKDYVNNNRTTVSAGDNIEVSEDNGNYTVSTSKNPILNTVTLNDGNNESKYNTTGVNITYRDGDNSTEYHTSYSYDGIHIKTNDGYANPISEVHLTDNGLNNGGHTITNVSRGKTGTDAVNVDQLKEVENKINHINGNVLNQAKDYTDSQMAKVGAASAALAALHPLDFDRDDKYSYSVGFGNYKNATATAMGAFYRPNENTMINVATTLGSNRNMVSVGANFKFGPAGKKLSAAKQVELEAQVKDLTTKYNDLEAKYNKLVAMLDKK